MLAPQQGQLGKDINCLPNSEWVPSMSGTKGLEKALNKCPGCVGKMKELAEPCGAWLHVAHDPRDMGLDAVEVFMRKRA
jgi:hypothetical protein